MEETGGLIPTSEKSLAAVWTLGHHRVGRHPEETDSIVLDRAVAARTRVAVADVCGFGYFLKAAGKACSWVAFRV